MFLRRAGGEIIMYFEPRIAFPPDGRECENSLETLSPSVGILVRTLNGISMRFLSPSFFYLRRNQDRSRLGWAQISEVWEMVLLVFWQSSSGQEQCHLMFLESHSARKGRVSLNGDFSKETWEVPSRKLLCHLSGSLLGIPTVSASLATITRPL